MRWRESVSEGGKGGGAASLLYDPPRATAINTTGIDSL